MTNIILSSVIIYLLLFSLWYIFVGAAYLLFCVENRVSHNEVYIRNLWYVKLVLNLLELTTVIFFLPLVGMIYLYVKINQCDGNDLHRLVNERIYNGKLPETGIYKFLKTEEK